MTSSVSASGSRSVWEERVAHAEARGRELIDASYPTRDEISRQCDLVMKGGISSGVVYPFAACELAKRYRFRSIGGSSAGAIAATIVAAAEYGRDHGGFQRLAALPATIGSTLPSLFTAGAATGSAHAILMAGLDPSKTGWRKWLGVLVALIRSKWSWFAAGLVGGLLVALVVALTAAGWPGDVGDAAQLVGAVTVALPVSMVAGLVAVSIAQALTTQRAMDGQGFGICVCSAGPDARTPTPQDPGGLTDWLAVKIDEVAGVDQRDVPLTFADLWGSDPAERDIDLQVMTTDLSHGRPTSFPFAAAGYLYDPVELGRWFPPRVMTQLAAHATPALDANGRAWTVEGRPLVHFPAAEHVPVVFAARVSLSFPGLISAVPLWVIDDSSPEPSRHRAVRCWLSDGGITSNFPIHFFDALWPGRPTFGLSLAGYPADAPEADVDYPGPALEGRRRPPRTIEGLPGFVHAILDTMQYWADDAQAALPGYRDRVVEVRLSGDEGGMNLRMPAERVAVVAEKGRQAAEALASFDFDNHRWTRFLTAMDELQSSLARMRTRYDSGLAGGVDSYADLLAREPDTRYSYYRDQRWVAAATTRVDTLLSFAAGAQPDFNADAPTPEPVLRITPKF